MMYAFARRDFPSYHDSWERKEADPAARADFPNLLRQMFYEAVQAKFSAKSSLLEITEFCHRRRIPYSTHVKYSRSMAIDLIAWALGKNPSTPDWAADDVAWHLHQLFVDIVGDLELSDAQLDCLIVAAERRVAHARGVPYPMWPATGGVLEASRIPDGAGAEAAAPRSIEEVTSPVQCHVDCGGLLVPLPPAMKLSFEQATTGLSAVVLASEGLQIQLQAFAQEPGAEQWDSIRREVRDGSLVAQGAIIEEVTGPFGTELWLQIPVVIDDGPAVHFIRTLAYEGSGWLLRGAIGGPAAFDRAVARPFEEAFRDVIVVPPHEKQAPRTLIPLHLPEP